MALETNLIRGVLNHYGPRSTDSHFGNYIDDDVIKTYQMEFRAPSSAAENTSGMAGMSSAAWAKTNLDFILPFGATILSAEIRVETAFDALTGLDIGTYSFDAAGAVTAIDADGIGVSATIVLTAIDAIGDRIVCAGAQVNATGTGSSYVIPAGGAVIRVLYTGTIPTVGKARLLVRFVTSQA